MIILLSPSKGQDFDHSDKQEYTQPQMVKQSEHLMKQLKKLSKSQIQKLMSVSEQLAELNHSRFQTFNTPFKLGPAKQAALAFKGDVYSGLEAQSWSGCDFKFAQKHLRILSGLYGYLKPLDLIMPYRLEMKTKLINDKGENLYQFWDKAITEAINSECDGENDFVVNLASNEYFKAVKKKLLNSQLITINFKDTKAGKTRVIGFYAKKARGMMAKALIKNRIQSVDKIKSLVIDGYRYNELLSMNNEWVFERTQPAPKA